MSYEYKIVGAPEKGMRKRGLRSQSDRVAAAFEAILEDEAVDGWEYLRTDLLPVTEGASWFKRGHEVHRAVMVFRRLLDREQAESDVILRRAPSVNPPAHTAANTAATPAVKPAPPPIPTRPLAPEPEVSDDPDLRIADIVRGLGNPKSEG